MADFLGAVALNHVQFQQDVAIAALKQDFDAQEQVVQLVAQTSGSGELSSGPQRLNAEGRGQVVNLLA
ncbi:MAG: hypothetical protein RIM33_06955 [Alphaproteobacteria bacterium]